MPCSHVNELCSVVELASKGPRTPVITGTWLEFTQEHAVLQISQGLFHTWEESHILCFETLNN